MTEEPAAKKKRRVYPKKLFIFRAVNGSDPDRASSFEAVAGPVSGIDVALATIKKDLPDGKYVLMFEGRSVIKSTVPVTQVKLSE